MREAPADLEVLRAEAARLRADAADAERRLSAMHAVTRVLAEETSVDAAMPRILAALGGALEATLGAHWVPSGAALEVRTVWASAHHQSAIWEHLCRRHRMSPGAGLPGEVWHGRGAVWLQDLADPALVRRDGLLELRVRSGLAFPITLRGEVVGVIELFSARPQALDDHLRELLRSIGIHLGNFVQHGRTQHALREQLAHRQQMARAGQVFASTLDVDHLLAALPALACPWLADGCTLHVPDGALVASHSSAPTLVERGDAWHAAGDAAVTTALATREPQLVERPTASAAVRERMDSAGISSIVVVPILARGTPVAAMRAVRCASRRAFVAEDIALLEELAIPAGLAIANARTLAELQATTRELEADRQTLEKLQEVTRTISGELDHEALVQAVTDAATQLTGARFGALSRHVLAAPGDPSTPYPSTLYPSTGASRDAVAQLPMPRNPVAVRVDDITRDPRFGKPPPSAGPADDHAAVRSYLAVPVVARSGTVLGGMYFGHELPGVFTERSQRLAVALAAHAGVAMDNARLYGDARGLIAQLEKTNTELDQFAYVASHDLRAPLRGIANLALWIEEDLGPATPPIVRDHLELLKGRAARMDRLIDGLLELARVGRTRQRPERVDVTELVHETIDLLGPTADARVLIVGAMPTLVAERVALQRVFLNLLENALQHAGRPDVEVRITATEHAESWEIAVADNGSGIAREHHEQVWQLFHTLAGRDLADATGIGLTIVRKQVEANGGRAWIDPDVHEGVTVRFTWPKRAR